jgi:hypothetical protein
MQEPPNRPRAAILIPGTVNYFYNQTGTRLAEVLQALGMDTEVCTLASCPDGDFDYGFICNISEVLFAFGDETAGLTKLGELRRRCGHVASCAIDCVQTHWYRRVHELSTRSEVDCILDLGLHDQSRFLDDASRYPALYRFVFSGLTPSEQELLDAGSWQDTGRSIPWAFIGHHTPSRVLLVDHLIQTVSPQGFVYVPPLAPYTDKGSPHLNQQQYESVLRHTRYQVWCSHHAHFYMEPERFRASLLTGGVPIRIVDSRNDIPKSAPFSYLLMEADDTRERLTSKVFAQVRRRFQNEWRAFPTLAEELARVLDYRVDFQSVFAARRVGNPPSTKRVA